MADPFRIEGPALIQFSGGRTSAYMLWRILQAHGGTLPDDVKVAFENTGREMPQTLDFVRDCGERWGVEIAWLEYMTAPLPADRWRRVIYETASRNGEPFAALIAAKKMLPNPAMRFCTQNLKLRVAEGFARSMGWRGFTTVVGLRADEPQRVARSRARSETGRDRFDTVMPLATAGTTKQDVAAFWAAQNWGLALPTVNGTTPLGNCDLCFLKGAATIAGILRDQPGLAEWWIGQEARGTFARDASMGRFRKDRPSYAAMLDAVQRQSDFDFGDEKLDDCYCTGDA